MRIPKVMELSMKYNTVAYIMIMMMMIIINNTNNHHHHHHHNHNKNNTLHIHDIEACEEFI